MQSSRRTYASVGGTLTMVLLTIVLAAWSSPQDSTTPPNNAANTEIVR